MYNLSKVCLTSFSTQFSLALKIIICYELRVFYKPNLIKLDFHLNTQIKVISIHRMFHKRQPYGGHNYELIPMTNILNAGVNR